MRLGFLTLMLGSCLLATKSFAQVSVRVDRAAKLFAQPTERSLVLTEIGGRSVFRALEQSGDRQWIFISDGLRYGWIRKTFLRGVDESAAALSESGIAPTTKEATAAADAPPDDDLPTDNQVDETASAPKTTADEVEDDDDEGNAKASDTYIIKKPGALYDKPRKNSTRFGKLEVNDQVTILKNSNDGKWVRVRLEETGEEGWVPRLAVARKVPSDELNDLDRQSDRKWHFAAYVLASPTPWGIGALGTLSRSFESLSIADIPVELGAGFGYSMGSQTTYLTKSIKATYADFRGFARYEPRLTASFSIPIELGALLKYGIISTNLTQAEFAASNSRIRATEAGFYLGVGVNYILNDAFKIVLLPELQITSSLDLVAEAGLQYNF